MIAVDTHVLVRYLVRDDPEQAEAARALLQSATAARLAYVCREVVVELVLLLERAYGYSRDRIATILEEVVATEGLVVETADDVARAAFRYRSASAGFADVTVLAAAGPAATLPLYAFDGKSARLEAVELLR